MGTRFLGSRILSSFLLCLFLFVTDILWQAFAPDVSYIPDDRRDRNLLVAFRRDGNNAFLQFEDRFVVFTSPSVRSRYVVAANTKLLHARKLSNFLPRLFYSIVLLDDGSTTEWEGWETDYLDAVNQAGQDSSKCLVDVFFKKSNKKP